MLPVICTVPYRSLRVHTLQGGFPGYCAVHPVHTVLHRHSARVSVPPIWLSFCASSSSEKSELKRSSSPTLPSQDEYLQDGMSAGIWVM